MSCFLVKARREKILSVSHPSFRHHTYTFQHCLFSLPVSLLSLALDIIQAKDQIIFFKNTDCTFFSRTLMSTGSIRGEQKRSETAECSELSDKLATGELWIEHRAPPWWQTHMLSCLIHRKPPRHLIFLKEENRLSLTSVVLLSQWVWVWVRRMGISLFSENGSRAL